LFAISIGSVARFFDGAQQRGVCKVGATIGSIHKVMYFVWLNDGQGYNTNYEVLGFWILLSLATSFKIGGMQGYGDSQVVIEWLLGKNRFQGINLTSSMMRINKLNDNYNFEI